MERTILHSDANCFYCSVEIMQNPSLESSQFQCRLDYQTQSTWVVAQAARLLFFKRYSWAKPVRSITVRVIHLVPENTPQQLSLFCTAADAQSRLRLEAAVDRLRERFGKQIICPACLMSQSAVVNPSAVQPTMPGQMFR